MRSRLWLWSLGSIAALGLFALSSANTYADVKPGDFITSDNAEKVKDLVSPGVYYKVEHGMSMKIIPTERVDWPPPYKEMTEKYSAQVRLTDDHRSLLGYVSGQPFPLLDVNDPQVATKIMWNTVFKPMWTDDYDLRFYDCDSVYNVKGKQQSGQIEYFQIGHYAGYQLTGRTEVEPLPVDPDFKKTGRYWIFGLYPVLAPAEIRGTDSSLRVQGSIPLAGSSVPNFTAAGTKQLQGTLNFLVSTKQAQSSFSVQAWEDGSS